MNKLKIKQCKIEVSCIILLRQRITHSIIIQVEQQVRQAVKGLGLESKLAHTLASVSRE